MSERDENAEIRQWGRDNGYDVKDGGRIPAELRSAWATASAAGEDDHDDAGGTAPWTFPPLSAVPEDAAAGAATAAGPRSSERPPQPPGRAGRLREAIRERRDGAGRRHARRRTSLETLGTIGWGGLARGVSALAGGTYLPVAKMMAFQGPVAGLVLEDAVKGTAADVVLQPVARLVASGSAAGALIFPPLLTAAVCRKPELYPVVRPMLVSAMREWVIVAGPKLRELHRREEKFKEEMGEFGAEFGVTIDQLLDMVFEPPPGEAAPEAPPAGADGHAAA